MACASSPTTVTPRPSGFNDRGLPEDLRGVALVDAWRQRLHTLQMTPPRVVERGPVQQNVLTGSDVDLTRFPAPHRN